MEIGKILKPGEGNLRKKKQKLDRNGKAEPWEMWKVQEVGLGGRMGHEQ